MLSANCYLLFVLLPYLVAFLKDFVLLLAFPILLLDVELLLEDSAQVLLHRVDFSLQSRNRVITLSGHLVVVLVLVLVVHHLIFKLLGFFLVLQYLLVELGNLALELLDLGS